MAKTKKKNHYYKQFQNVLMPQTEVYSNRQHSWTVHAPTKVFFIDKNKTNFGFTQQASDFNVIKCAYFTPLEHCNMYNNTLTLLFMTSFMYLSPAILCFRSTRISRAFTLDVCACSAAEQSRSLWRARPRGQWNIATISPGHSSMMIERLGTPKTMIKRPAQPTADRDNWSHIISGTIGAGGAAAARFSRERLSSFIISRSESAALNWRFSCFNF